MQKVLMIDNAKLMHSVVKARLAGEQIEFHSAFDGESGLALAAKLLPDVILLDVEMPPPNGFEVCKRLKQDPALSSVPIIFLTAICSSDEKVKGLDLGAADYVTKPFDAPELQARVRAALRTRYLLNLLATTARIDGLTGLWNRGYLEERMRTETAAFVRHGTPIGCILTDVDHFKNINDTYGHRGGDHILRSIAQLLKAGVREMDIVCRYGGEEFAILTPGVEGPGLQIFAERLRAAVEQASLQFGSHQVKVTCSFGIADCSNGPIESLIERADKALYAAKQSGRNRVIASTATPIAVGRLKLMGVASGPRQQDVCNPCRRRGEI